MVDIVVPKSNQYQNQVFYQRRICARTGLFSSIRISNSLAVRIIGRPKHNQGYVMYCNIMLHVTLYENTIDGAPALKHTLLEIVLL